MTWELTELAARMGVGATGETSNLGDQGGGRENGLEVEMRSKEDLIQYTGPVSMRAEEVETVPTWRCCTERHVFRSARKVKRRFRGS